ncbi:MAG: HesA/MoeB/ThiF family protein [Planctomyces sp.]|nr:HesA/MoeB/ThiF family protein [Planctomyces sp.]
MPLTPEESARYEWQMWAPEFGKDAQEKLRQSSVLISRVGGVGGAVALYLAAAGVGRLVLAHAGNVRPSDLNRQILMTTDWIGRPRLESARRRLSDLNPHVDVVTVPQNMTNELALEHVEFVDLVVDAAPLFSERFAMNAAAVRFRKPLIECAMYHLTAQLTTIIPGQTPCLRCLYPDDPVHWKRQFPVLGATAGVAGTLAAIEVIKTITGIGETLAGRLLTINLKSMEFRHLPIERLENCSVCGQLK